MNQDISSLTAYSDVVISEETPTDTSKVWYKPNGVGGMEIYKYDGNSWVQIGTTGDMTTEGSVSVPSIVELEQLPCFEGDKGFVDLPNNTKVAYTCSSSNSWLLGGVFEGDFNIIDLATTYHGALDGTTVNVNGSNGEFTNKAFTKNGNHWADSANEFYIFDTQQNLLGMTLSVGSTSFFPKDSQDYYLIKKYDLPSLGNKWIHEAPSGSVDFGTGEIISVTQVVNSITSMYIDKPDVTLYNGSLFIKDFDTLNRIVYKKTDNTFWARTGLIPSNFIVNGKVSLPPAYHADGAVWRDGNLLLDNRTQGTLWLDAPNGATIDITNVAGVYTHRVNQNSDFWTNDNSGDGQVNATEIFTKGSRSSLPNVTHSIVALTKEVGTEPNYTSTGITSTVDSSFKQWYYSSSGTITNGLLDDPCLTRTKEGSQLTADFANNQCYAQKATIVTRYAKWEYGNGNYSYVNRSDDGAQPVYSYQGDLTKCSSNNIGGYSYEIGTSFCILRSIVYTANSGWNKLNNSIQEYRENF